MGNFNKHQFNEDLSLIAGFIDGLRPEPRYTVTEWADAHRYLSPNATAEPGPWRTSRVPYTREVMDDLSSSSPVRKVVVMKGAQIAFTEMGCNWLGYIMDAAPGPALMVMPTEETLKKNSKTRIAPMIEATPRLRQRVSAPKSRDGNNSVLFKSFPGGQLIMAPATSAAGLRSLPIRYLFLDEVDGYPPDVDGEGSPIELAIARTSTFSRKKIFMISTPTVEGISVISQEYQQTDQRKYFVPCPHCSEFQTIELENIKWTSGSPQTAKLYCIHCGSEIQERFKTRMLAEGEWRVTAPENERPDVKGYYLSSLYSPFGWKSWAEIAEQYEKANPEGQEDPVRMKTFVNTVLGQPYAESAEVPEWEDLFNRRLLYPIGTPPKEVMLLTAGCDVQKDRLEIEILGWGAGKRSFSVDYHILIGDTAKPEVWEQLTELIETTWTREDGQALQLRMVAIDAGFRAQTVYNYCRKFSPGRVIPIRGNDRASLIIGRGAKIDVKVGGKRVGHVKVYSVGINICKSELYGWLRLEIREDGSTPPGWCEFPQYGEDYFKGLTSEKLVTRVDKKGFTKQTWERNPSVRNEPLDCRIYARIAAAAVGIDRMDDSALERLSRKQIGSAQLGSKEKPANNKPKRKRKSDFW